MTEVCKSGGSGVHVGVKGVFIPSPNVVEARNLGFLCRYAPSKGQGNMGFELQYIPLLGEVE